MAGRVEAVLVREGDRVSRGQPLVRLTAADVATHVETEVHALESARSAEREACSTAALAERDLARLRPLLDAGAVAAEEVDRGMGRRDASRAACAAAAARTRQMTSTLQSARVAQAKTILRAPFAGVITTIGIDTGEWITPSPPGDLTTPPIEMFDDTAIYINAPLDEADLGRVATGLPVRVTMDAYPSKIFMGRIVRVSSYVRDREEQNRTFDVEVILDDPALARTLRPGTSADVVVIAAARDNVVRLSADALQSDGTVLVVRDGILVKTPVTVGLRNWDFAEVIEGPAVGETVVVSLDRPEIKAGARARIRTEVRR
jgi:HlyD family secretion protein